MTPAKEAHTAAWAATVLILLAGAGRAWTGLRIARHEKSPSSAAAAGDARWFLMLRMPEITTQREAGVDTMKGRIDEWLAAMTDAGYRPVLLTDAVRRLSRGDALPEKAVVVFFNPGYRRTYQIVAPIFRRRGWPVTWLTSEGAMNRLDRRYVTFRALDRMRGADGWDAGFDGRLDRLLDDPAAGWSPTAGATALDRRETIDRLRFLTADENWSGTELVARLQAEVPAAGTTALTAALVSGREWGTVRLSSAPDAGSFDLQAPEHMPGVKIFWLGTEGRRDCVLAARAENLIGELWLQLRFDEVTGDGVNLILLDRSAIVEQWRGRKLARRVVLRQPESFRRRRFALVATLRGERLTVAVDGRPAETVDRLTETTTRKGLVQIYLADKLRGTAKVDGLGLSFTPL